MILCVAPRLRSVAKSFKFANESLNWLNHVYPLWWRGWRDVFDDSIIIMARLMLGFDNLGPVVVCLSHFYPGARQKTGMITCESDCYQSMSSVSMERHAYLYLELNLNSNHDSLNIQQVGMTLKFDVLSDSNRPTWLLVPDWHPDALRLFAG